MVFLLNSFHFVSAMRLTFQHGIQFSFYHLLAQRRQMVEDVYKRQAGNSKRQIKFITDFKTTALHAIPSYAIRLAEVFQEEGIDPASTTLRRCV